MNGAVHALRFLADHPKLWPVAALVVFTFLLFALATVFTLLSMIFGT